MGYVMDGDSDYDFFTAQNHVFLDTENLNFYLIINQSLFISKMKFVRRDIAKNEYHVLFFNRYTIA